MLRSLLIVGIGSFTGGVLRYLISKLIQDSGFHTFPLGTFLVNVVGCFAIGLFYGLFERNNLISPDMRLFLTVGFCGGFTTFSTFINESYQLIRDANFFYLFFYIALSLLVGLLMLYVGYSLIKIL
ncbi:fluoride efflux transporter CrcB [Bacteroides ilei]|jgi:CrcB protein|uniref:fluoride efflux transporter CrcB n=1 Tax=Bacteroides ilei TaxID=1907658 RepID=UPI0009305531|nr:fluoride efflux transporter CrcB [Bacteroides ilei]